MMLTRDIEKNQLWLHSMGRKQQTHGWRYGDLSLKRANQKSNNEQRGFQSFFFFESLPLYFVGVKQMIIYAAVWHGRFSSFLSHGDNRLGINISIYSLEFQWLSTLVPILNWYAGFCPELRSCKEITRKFFSRSQKKVLNGQNVSAAFQTFVRK